MNRLSLVVLTADGILHVFGLNGGGGNGSGGGNGGNGSGKKGGMEEKGMEFLQTIPMLHTSESTRMMTAQNAKTSGAFFDLSSHVFTCRGGGTKRSGTNHGQSNNTKDGNGNPSSSSWLVTKSKEGVGYISVYKTSRKDIFLTEPQEGDQHPSKTTTTKIVKKKRKCMELVHSFQAHTHTIARVAIGGAIAAASSSGDDGGGGCMFATTSLKVRRKNSRWKWRNILTFVV